MNTKPIALVAVVLLMLLAAACAPTHNTIADVITGQEGDRAEFDAVLVTTDVEFLENWGHTGRNYVRFDACDRHGDCLRFMAIAPGRHPVQDDFVRIMGGEILFDEGVRYVRANLISVVARPDDWPEDGDAENGDED